MRPVYAASPAPVLRVAANNLKSYTFRDTAHGKALFDLSESGYIYSRIGNVCLAHHSRVSLEND